MMKINECFSYDKVKDVSDRFFRQCKYYGSDYNSDESIHYAEGHGFNYHENDKIKVEKKKDKMIVDESLKQNESSNIKKNY